MQFDSIEQKNMVLEWFRKYPCNVETALQLARNYGKDVESGKIIVEKKDDQDTPDNPPVRISKSEPGQEAAS